MKNKTNLKMITILCMVIMAGFSLSTNVYSALLPSIIETYGLSMTAASVFNMTTDAGYFIAMVFAMLFADRMRKDVIIIVAGLLFGLTMILMGQVPIYLIMFILKTIMGLMGSILDNISVAYISDLYGEERSKKIALIHIFYAVGALLAPSYAGVMLKNYSWNTSYSSMGFIMLLCSVVFIGVAWRGAPKAQQAAGSSLPAQEPKASFLDLLRTKKMLLLVATSICQSGTFVIIIWLPTYLLGVSSERYTVEFGILLVSLYSLLSVVARALLGPLLRRMVVTNYLKYGAFVSAVAVATALLADNSVVWIVAIVIYGLTSGGSYTAHTILICSQFPTQSATSTAICGVARSAGNILLNAAIGALLQQGQHVLALFSIVAALGLLGLLCAVFYNKEGVLRTPEAVDKT